MTKAINNNNNNNENNNENDDNNNNNNTYQGDGGHLRLQATPQGVRAPQLFDPLQSEKQH